MSAPRRRQGVFLPMSIVVALSVALALGTLYTYEEICSMAMEMQPIQTLALHLTSVAGLGGDTASSKSAPPRQQTPIVVRDLTVTMQWDDQCFASLFADPPVTRNGTTDAETIAETCNCKPRPTLDDPDDAEVTDAEVVPPSMEELSRTIAFVEDNDAADANKEEERQTIVADAYPKAVSWRIKSEGVVCGDILDATLLETHGPLFAVTLSPTPAPTAKPPPETTSSEETGVADPVPPTPSPPPTPLATRAIPALVTAQGDGTYTVSATLPAEGDYELLVRLAFRNWVPRKECRATLCRENYDVPTSVNLTKPFPYITKRLRASLKGGSSSSSSSADEGDKEAAARNSSSTWQPCASMDTLMDGSWVADPTAMLGYDPLLEGQVKPTHGWRTVWQPHTCRLQLYTPEAMRAAFEGKHFLVIGDSATHMLLGVMMWIILGPEFRYPTNGGEFCGHNNRVYDSGDMLYPMRFSFLWVGSPGYCDNNKGLPSVLGDAGGLARFKRGLGKNVDYVVMNSGAHDLAGNVPLDDYDRVLPMAFDMVLNASQSVREHRERFLWRTTTQHIYDVGEWNAGGRWMNLLAERHARQYGFSILDSHKVWLADDELRRANAEEQVFCGDGLHGRSPAQEYCDKTFAEAALAVHHFMQLAGGGRLDEEGAQGIEEE